MKERIVIIEDEPDIRELLEYNLAKEGYPVAPCESAEEGWKAVRARRPDLIVLDLMLPGQDGLSFCKDLKRDPVLQDIPVLMLSAKGEEADIVIGLELGADDYVTKPFSPKVLLARIRTIVRRRTEETPAEDRTLVRGDLEVDPVRFIVKVKGKIVDLTATEFGVLHFLARRPGWVFTRQQIVDAVKGEEYAVTERSVDVQIVGLRKKLAACADYIETVRGVGYRFKEGVG